MIAEHPIEVGYAMIPSVAYLTYTLSHYSNFRSFAQALSSNDLSSILNIPLFFLVLLNQAKYHKLI